MMINEAYSQDVYIADFTNFVGKHGYDNLPCQGVMVGIQENGIIPSFIIHDERAYPFCVINNEHNPAVFKREDGSPASQCECIVCSERNDNRKGWLFFLELKYCEPKQRIIEYAMNYAMDEDMATSNALKEKKRKYEDEWRRQVDAFSSYLSYNKMFVDKLNSKIDKQDVAIDELRIGVRDKGYDLVKYREELNTQIDTLNRKAEQPDTVSFVKVTKRPCSNTRNINAVMNFSVLNLLKKSVNWRM